MKKVVLAGGGGNLGKALTRSFVSLGYQVVILTRQNRPSSPEGVQFVQWDAVQLGEWVKHLERADVLINLCGESIAKSLTEANKQILWDSRIVPTRLLGEAIQQLHNPPAQWINLSGISIFENIEGLHDEQSNAVGATFLAQLSKAWEDAFRSCEVGETQKVIVRVSPVLTAKAGMFAELYPLVRYGLGGTVGSGKQFVSWIHEADFICLIHWVIATTNPAPIYHACSPHPETNADFMAKFRHAVGIKMGLPLPTFLAKLGAWVKGVDDGLLLGSVAATSRSAVNEGFQFTFPKLEEALHNLLDLKKH